MKLRRLVSRVRAACHAAALLSLTLTAACGSLATEAVQTTAPNPDYLQTIAKRLQATFSKAPLSGPIEISDPRWVLSNKGWGWIVCIRFQDRGHQRTYVMIFDRNEFLDERYAVQTDACGAQTYSGFDPGSGGMRPSSVGDPGPLY
jgi:hypothetical protein